MTTKHTPTPWRVDPDFARDIQTADGKIEVCAPNQWGDLNTQHLKVPTRLEAEANAAFIVRAVNHHEALVEMVRHMQGYLFDSGVSAQADKLLAALDAAQ